MNSPSKLMCQLASLSRGLDVENTEHKKKSRSELAVKLRSIITLTDNLEKQELDQSVSLFSVKDCTIKLLEEIENGANPAKLKEYALGILEILDQD